MGRIKVKFGTETKFGKKNPKIEVSKFENSQIKVKQKKKKKKQQIMGGSWKLALRLILGQRIWKLSSRKRKIFRWKWRRRKRRNMQSYQIKLKIGTETKYERENPKL